MITIPFILVFGLLGYKFGNKIRKHNKKIYITVTILALLIFVMRDKFKFAEPFIQGYLGLSFLYIVMFTGALKDKSKLSKKFMGIRREYSIIGFIFLSAHALNYVLQFLSGDIRFEWFGVIPYVIMLPLFITSFMIFRKKFTYTAWKKLQSFAYIAYILIFVHLIIVAEMPNLAVYIVLFVPYIVLKLMKEIKKRVL